MCGILMLVSVLASGSKGNSTYVKTSHHELLIDAGCTMNYLNEKLIENNTSLDNIEYIFVTHTHTDHVSSIKNIVKKYHPTIILTIPMLEDLPYLKTYEKIILLEDDMIIDDLLIENIKTSHDTSDSRGYIITENNNSVVQITDTGYLNQKYFNKLKNKTIYVFESNHNADMLLNGRYPGWLKRRVASDKGHLSNESSAFYLSKIIGNDTKEIILAHLSEENNTPEIALETLKNEFKDHEIEFNNIVIAKQNEISGNIEVW